MAEEVVISLKNVSKCFKRYDRPVDRLKEILIPNKSYANDFWALQDINLEIIKGQTVGIVGRNGSGKSTLLQIIAQTLTPTQGELSVNGRVSALLELGSGFNLDFTGRQNVFFNGQILGLTQKEVEDKFDEIAAFADIGDFIDEPVKTYSSGMFVRLAFAVVINVNPEILIIDEALSVGDGVFVHRCMAKIRDFQDSGGTILFVSHDIGSVSRLCSQSVWINQGNIVEIGSPDIVSRHYQTWMYDQINNYHKEKDKSANTLLESTDKSVLPIDNTANLYKQNINTKLNQFTQKPYISHQNVDRFGTGRAEIIDFQVFDINNDKVGFVYPKDKIRLVVKVLSFDAVKQALIGITLYDRLRVPMSGVNTYQHSHKLPDLVCDNILTVEFHIEWPEIQGGNYMLEPAIASGSQDNHEMLDWLQFPMNIVSGVTDLTFGLFRIPNVNISHNLEHSYSTLVS